MIGTTIGVAYPGLYVPVTQTRIVPANGDVWYVDTFRCVSFHVVGLPWAEPTTWQFTPTVLPPCLAVGIAPPQICGTPMQVGTTTVTVRATDATGRVMTFSYTLTVRPQP